MLTSFVLDIRVIPRAPRTRVDGMRGGAILIRLAAPPVDGAANDALVAFLSDALALPRRNIRSSPARSRATSACRSRGSTRRPARARLLG